MRYIKSLLILALMGAFMVGCDLYEPTDEYSLENFYRFESLSSNVAENAPDPIAITVVFSSADGVDATGSVSFEVSGGVQGTDYTIENANNTLTFNSGNEFRDDILIKPVDNTTTSDSNIVLEIRLTNPSNGIIGFPGPDNSASDYVHKLTISDDDCVVIPIGGTYDAVTSGTSTDACCPNPAVDFMSTVTITPQGGNVYLLNDFSAGLYLEWYDIYGINSQDQSPAAFELVDPINGVIEIIPGQLEPFQTEIVGSGNYDPCTGVITYSWSNGYGDMGDVILTPQ